MNDENRERIEAFRATGHVLVEVLGDYLEGLADNAVFRPMTPVEREELLGLELPMKGKSGEELVSMISQSLLIHPMGNGHPRFFGWVNSPPALFGILGSFAAAAINPSCAGGDHAAIYLEHATVRWVAELCGFPLGYGLLTSGGSMASLVCLSAARHDAAARLGYDERLNGLSAPGAPRLVLYVSSETHSCVRKAAELLGIGAAGTRIVPVSSDGRFDVTALESMLAKDKSDGFAPFCVVASAGTVGTGFVDPLDELAELCEREQLWLHVDGAYGAFGILDPALSALYSGMDRADSLAVDPHKWLGVPVDCGCALVKDAAALRNAFSLVPAYLRTEEGEGFGGPPWFSEFTMEQTRPYRALKLWMTIASAGRSGIASLVGRCHELARCLGRLVEQHPNLALAAPVETSIVVFRYTGDGKLSEEELDELQKRLVSAVQERGKAFLSGTIVNGREVLRACILSDQTSESDLRILIEEIDNVGHELEGRLARL